MDGPILRSKTEAPDANRSERLSRDSQSSQPFAFAYLSQDRMIPQSCAQITILIHSGACAIATSSHCTGSIIASEWCHRKRCPMPCRSNGEQALHLQPHFQDLKWGDGHSSEDACHSPKGYLHTRGVPCISNISCQHRELSTQSSLRGTPPLRMMPYKGCIMNACASVLADLRLRIRVRVRISVWVS